MAKLSSIDLASDPLAAPYIKEEVVTVRFARQDGALISREGLNHYQVSDALITGSTGDEWVVSRARFEAKYAVLPPGQAGEEGRYGARPVPVLARQMSEPFSIARSAGGDILAGLAKDWLLQYAPGDFGIVENARFQQVYRLASQR
jgi:hypothetical protein